MPGTEIAKYADSFMFKAEKSDNTTGPKAYLLTATPDPLGALAAMAMMYEGKVVRNIATDVTDEDRRGYLEKIKNTKLKAPMEAIKIHYMLDDVTRGFTHQLVRQRTAVYAQESTRFAVKEDLASSVGLPPSLVGVAPVTGEVVWDDMSNEQKNLADWATAIEAIQNAYESMVNRGMPQEDARGLLPTNLLTRTNYVSDLRAIQDHAGNRLCTQAQFEWRLVWTAMIKAMREHCSCPVARDEEVGTRWHTDDCDGWQWRELSTIFRPVCYLTGKCEFMAEGLDRKCKIRERVTANHSIGRPSTEWDKDEYNGGGGKEIKAISPAEWLLDPAAAR